MKAINKLIVLALFFQIGTNLSAQNNDSIKEHSKMKTYIVLHRHSGNIRLLDTETEFIAEVYAENAPAALKKGLSDFDYYKIAYDSINDYAYTEDPGSYISDASSSFSAQKAYLMRNNKNELCFLVEFATSERYMGKRTVYKSKKIWGTDATKILQKQLIGKYADWYVNTKGKYTANAVQPSDIPSPPYKNIRVSVMYKLIK